MDKPNLEILLIDDHPLLRKGLAQLINEEEGLFVTGEAGNGQDGVQLALALEPDLVLLDLNMKGMDGLETLKILRAEGVDSRVVVLTVSEHREDVARMFRAGADGYLLKDMEPEELLVRIKESATGRLVVDDRLAEVLASILRPVQEEGNLLNVLTSKEREVLVLIAEGMANKMIARQLSISEGTVKVHVKRLLKKLGVRSRVEAAILVVKGSTEDA
ncbi:two-component system response regulator NarL [Endozoicomonas ascidiicola]|uniref:two-component system response regulator NarL n=1 Tax=Endozoicomonas ascidiicola TaxID=1698521 RepID=UPI0008336A2A|nr:two-component system response regulator NarL [Endozoicomonas ascidiicola]